MWMRKRKEKEDKTPEEIADEKAVKITFLIFVPVSGVILGVLLSVLLIYV